MSNSTRDLEHDAVRLILPWYVNGTVSTAEREQVTGHLVECAECRADVRLHREMQAAVRSETPTPMLPNRDPSELTARVVEKDTPLKRRSFAEGFALAATVAVVAVGIALFSGVKNTIFEPRTAEPAAAIEYVFRVEFADGVSTADRARIVTEMGASAVRPTEDPAVFDVAVRLESTSVVELEAYSNTLRQRPEIRSAEAIALQLPMR